MAYGVYKDLARRTASSEILYDEAFAIESNLKCE